VQFILLNKTKETSYKIGDRMNDKTRIEKLEEEGKLMIKIMDKLEQRITKLEKVLASHAKCIGEMREDNK
jgi:wobble nucleotide-excising tRNase